MQTTKKSGKEIADMLKNFLPEHKTVGEMGDYSHLEGYGATPDEQSKDLQQKRDRWVREERQKLYKAVDSDGNIFLITNPICWDRSTRSNDTTYKHRPQPQKVGRLDSINSSPTTYKGKDRHEF